MWLFLAACVAIFTPGVRSVLEVLFAELTVFFVNSIGLVSIACIVAFLFSLWLQQHPLPQGSNSSTPASRSASATRSMASLLFAAVFVPLPVLAGKPPYSLSDNATALASLRAKVTTCKYSRKEECIDNPTQQPEFGNYRQGPGVCSAMDSAYVPTPQLGNPLPNRYLPVSVEEANEQGFSNRFSEWKEQNQKGFQLDCPLLYEQLQQEKQDLLCCTESQYEGLSAQVQMIQAPCSSCKSNLRNVWCQFACNPNNSMFIDVQQVRLMDGDEENVGAVFPAMEEATYYVGDDWERDLYDSCKADGFFGIVCPPSTCKSGMGALEFMGTYQFGGLGSPLQVNFETTSSIPEAERQDKLCDCTSTNMTDCWYPLDNRLESCAGVCGAICEMPPSDQLVYTAACYGAEPQLPESASKQPDGDQWSELMAFMADNLRPADYTWLDYSLIISGGVLGLVLIVGFVFAAMKARREAPRRSTLLDDRSAHNGDSERLSFVDDLLTRKMKAWGSFVSTGRHPHLIIGIAMVVVIACSAGLSQIEVETNPVKLWVASSSRAYHERDQHGELFMPFYRPEQVLMVPKDGGLISRPEYLREAVRLQELLENVRYGPADADFPERIELNDICWKATGTACTVNTITQYYQNNLTHFDFYNKYGLALEHFRSCFTSPATADTITCGKLNDQLKDGDKIPSTMGDCPCLSSFGAPMNLFNTYLGGFPEDAPNNVSLYLESTAFVSTILVYNYYEPELNEPAILWEREFIDTLKVEASRNKYFDLFFMAETSVEDEIERSSRGDAAPVALSYSLMILYVAIGINRWRKGRAFFVLSKISVGLLGLLCIVFAVTTTIGLFMWCGAQLQLVIMQVVPFLALGIGVDNVFLIVNAADQKEQELRQQRPELFEKLDTDENVERAASAVVSEAMGFIGPSIVMASFAEAVAFAFGCISPMPAVLWFAAFAAGVMSINLVLQLTIFVAIVSLDKRRELGGRYDLLCCKKAPASVLQELALTQPTAEEGAHLPGNATPYLAETPKSPRNEDAGDLTSRANALITICIDAYVSVLSNRLMKLIVLLAFLVMTLLSIASIKGLSHGLPQADSMPRDSYVIDYFNALDKYLATGPPVFFVVQAGYGRNPDTFDLNDQALQSKLCRSKEFCDKNSIPAILNALANSGDSDITHFSPGTLYSWMDDFWGFSSVDTECCRLDADNAYMPIRSNDEAYTKKREAASSCLSTVAPPVPKESFMSLFSMFSTANAGPKCSHGGGSIYRGQFSIDNEPIPIVDDSLPPVKLNSAGYGKELTAFSYMLISTANPTQQDFIDSYKQARRAAEYVSETTGIDVWAYSITHVFFDQYLTVVDDTYLFVGLALTAILVIHVIYFGGLFYPIVITLGATNIVLNVMGLMEPLGIMLNGLSVVNLVVTAGVSVEFCAHFARLFAKARGTGDERVRQACHEFLSSLIFGIAATNIVGLLALTLAESRIFYKYYFVMYMTIVVCGILNGIVLLPVVLSVHHDVMLYFRRVRSAKGSERTLGGDAHGSPAYMNADK